jgi:hypothetical protein
MAFIQGERLVDVLPLLVRERFERNVPQYPKVVGASGLPVSISRPR